MFSDLILRFQKKNEHIGNYLLNDKKTLVYFYDYYEITHVKKIHNKDVDKYIKILQVIFKEIRSSEFSFKAINSIFRDQEIICYETIINYTNIFEFLEYLHNKN